MHIYIHICIHKYLYIHVHKWVYICIHKYNKDLCTNILMICLTTVESPCTSRLGMVGLRIYAHAIAHSRVEISKVTINGEPDVVYCFQCQSPSWNLLPYEADKAKLKSFQQFVTRSNAPLLRGRHVCLAPYIDRFTYIYIYMRIYVRNLCRYICMYIYIYIYIYMYVCIHIYVCLFHLVLPVRFVDLNIPSSLVICVWGRVQFAPDNTLEAIISMLTPMMCAGCLLLTL